MIVSPWHVARALRRRENRRARREEQKRARALPPFDWRAAVVTAAELQHLSPAEVATYDAQLPELRRFVPVRFWFGWAVWDVQRGRLAGGTPTGTPSGRADWQEQARAIEWRR